MTVHSTKLGESSPLQAGDSDESSYIDIRSIGKNTLRVTLRELVLVTGAGIQETQFSK